ncbi:MAG: alpha/beta hydrolase [Polyangiaceae bacterium]
MKPFEQLPFAEVPDRPRVPHPYFGSEARTLAIDSKPFGRVDVHVRVLGSGPPLLLVHGLMTTSYSFRYVLAPLAERFTVYAPDLVGAGRSTMADASYDPDAVAVSIGEIIDALGIRGAPCIGNSMGGYLMMRLAMRDPRAVSRLVNLHSPGLPTARMFALEAALTVVPRAPSILDWLIRRNPEKWVHENVHYFDETLKSREEHREYARPLVAPGGARALHHFLHETLAARHMRSFEAALRDLRGVFPIPLMLVYAKRDVMVPSVVGRRLSALLPTAEMVWLEEASHFAHVDAPQAFLAAAMPFLLSSKRVSGSPA